MTAENRLRQSRTAPPQVCRLGPEGLGTRGLSRSRPAITGASWCSISTSSVISAHITRRVTRLLALSFFLKMALLRHP